MKWIGSIRVGVVQSIKYQAISRSTKLAILAEHMAKIYPLALLRNLTFTVTAAVVVFVPVPR